MEQVRDRISDALERAAPYVVAIDGVLLMLAGGFAIVGSTETFQGEQFLLFIGGLALILFGIMILIRWNPVAVRTGLIGVTAGYFAAALSEFEVATDPCDIGATLERCAGHVPGGMPWAVYQGPLIIAILLFVFVAFEPLLHKES